MVAKKLQQLQTFRAWVLQGSGHRGIGCSKRHFDDGVLTAIIAIAATPEFPLFVITMSVSSITLQEPCNLRGSISKRGFDGTWLV